MAEDLLFAFCSLLQCFVHLNNKKIGQSGAQTFLFLLFLYYQYTLVHLQLRNSTPIEKKIIMNKVIRLPNNHKIINRY